ncbi:MAG TPA: hypothetical protein EYG86_00395 [Crocinitomicaceae bacterium]|nr:hypothetical protein [Crocinitomicaceae bacterium]
MEKELNLKKMKPIQIKNIIGVMAVFIAFSFKTYGQQQDSTKRDNSLMSKAVKHNKKILDLQYNSGH